MSHRRRRPDRRPFGRVEQLETRRLLAVDVVQPLADVSVSSGAGATTIDLSAAFDLADVTGTVVRFSSGLGPDIYAELFDTPGAGRVRTTPLTVANFLAYVDAGLYTNTIFHRSVPGFVVQAGGFRLTDSGAAFVDAVPQFASVVNEPGNTNARGTLAMAKLGGDPDSATNQFFVNLADNAGNLDSQNGGFTAFGRVLGSGMDLIDGIAALPRYNFGSPFNELPTVGLDDPDNLSRENFVTLTGVSRVGELVFTATSSDPALAAATIGADGSLVIDYAADRGGVATITVRAASVFNPADFSEEQFTVTLAEPPAPEPPAPEPPAPEPPAPRVSVIVTGSEIGAASQPWVTVIDPVSGTTLSRFLAYEAGFRGGVRVALGDVVGDGTEQVVTAPGPGRVGEIRVFRQDGTELVAYRTLPFTAAYRGGVEVAAGDIDGNRVSDIVAAASRGPGQIHAYFVTPNAARPVPATPSRSFVAFPRGFLGGASVTTADVGTFAAGRLVNAAAADGRSEVVVGSGAGRSPQVVVYDLTNQPTAVRTIATFTPALRGGVSVAAGRYQGGPVDDIIVTGGFGAGSRIEVHPGQAASGGRPVVSKQAFASLANRNLPVYAAAVAQPGRDRADTLAVVQGSGSGLGVVTLNSATPAEFTLASLSGPLRVAASRPVISSGT